MATSRFLTLPAADVFSISNRLNRLFSEAWGDFGTPENGTAGWVPPVDVIEEDGEIRISVELPGVKPEDVKISLENSVLTIEGHKEQRSETSKDRVHRYERSYGAFSRTFTLPSTVEGDRIKATYEHGVLTVNLPKAERAKPRLIPVTA